MSLTRRAFLLSCSAAALTSCGKKQRDQSFIEIAQACKRHESEHLRIDMHCHLMNLRDIHEGQFVTRRFLQVEHLPIATDLLLKPVFTAAGKFLQGTANSAQTEAGFLASELKLPSTAQNPSASYSDGHFCNYGFKTQKGFVKVGTKGDQATGIFSNKSKNAARMLALFPEVDLFTPSITDLFDEGYKRGAANAPSFQISYYSQLHEITKGRFMPLMSYHPAREFEYEKRFNQRLYLREVRRALQSEGFIGVKVHPSAGFSPIENHRYGCTNPTSDQSVWKRETDDELFKRFAAYDRYMKELFELCTELDVPILTHNSTGPMVNYRCMRGARPKEGENPPVKGVWKYPYHKWGYNSKNDGDELDWTNSPKAWARAIETHGQGKLRVCLGHFADGFKEGMMPGTKQRTLYVSNWLKNVLSQKNLGDQLFVDLSIITDFFRDETGRKDEVKPAYQALFDALTLRYPRLKEAMMYGTDWHMPRTAMRSTTYLAAIENLIQSSGWTNQVMGTNAVRFFGLSKGRKTRERLNAFYHNRGIPLNEVRWMARGDAAH